MKLPALSGHKLAAALQKAGWQVVRQKGSHLILRHPQKENPAVITLNWTYGRRVLKPFLKSIGLTEQEFRKLL